MKINMFDYREALGEGIWLWHLLNTGAKVSNELWWDVGDEAFADEDLAVSLRIAAATARRWRVKLEATGLIRSFPVGRHTRKIQVRFLNYTEPQDSVPAADSDAAVN